MKVLLVLPGYDGTSCTQRTMAAAQAKERVRGTDIVAAESSFLTYNFNLLWCLALNYTGYTHWVMLHSDIVPQVDDWLDQLLEQMRASDADILSVVSPLKLPGGETSTALAKGEDMEDYRRVTLPELAKLPRVFSRREVAGLWGWDWKECTLLVNTGVMVVNMRKRAALSEMCFTVKNEIRKNAKGEYYAVSEPEDWNWSRQAHARGLSVWATKAIPIIHKGARDYENHG